MAQWSVVTTEWSESTHSPGGPADPGLLIQLTLLTPHVTRHVIGRLPAPGFDLGSSVLGLGLRTVGGIALLTHRFRLNVSLAGH